MTCRLARVARIDCAVEAYDWAFARDESARIDAHWSRLRAAKPALFNGRVLLASRLEVDGDALRGACFETGYKCFLAWRDFGFPGAAVLNCFAMPALRAADGAFLLGEMSAGTANEGRLYFPAGTPEPADLDSRGRVNFEGSILRELEEETGITPGEIMLDGGWTIVSSGRPVVACMRLARSSLDTAALQARFAAFIAAEANPELSRLVPVRGVSDLDPARMPDFMLTYLREALSPP